MAYFHKWYVIFIIKPIDTAPPNSDGSRKYIDRGLKEKYVK